VLPNEQYFPEAEDVALHAMAFARMMIAHARFEEQIRILQGVIAGDQSFGEQPGDQWTNRERSACMAKLIKNKLGDVEGARHVADRRMCRSPWASRLAMSAKQAIRPRKMPSIHPRALAIAVSSSIAQSSRWEAADRSTSWVSVSFIGISVRLTTASRAVTTEAPLWRESRRGRIPEQLAPKCQSFWIILLLGFQPS
jgi:hypothetical protein